MNRKDRRGAGKHGGPAAATGDPALHLREGAAYLAKSRWAKADQQFTRAIALLDANTVLEIATQPPVIAACLQRVEGSWPRQLKAHELFGPIGVAAVAREVFLQSALKSIWVCNWAIENLLTQLRRVLLERAATGAAFEETELSLLCALAQQCFINEYVFSQSDDETRQERNLRDALAAKLAGGQGDISATEIAAVAAYHPLCKLPQAEHLLRLEWPPSVADLLRQQVREPIEEQRDRVNIPALTTIDDSTSVQVRDQYEENPYPRWIGFSPERVPNVRIPGDGSETTATVLVAGCGTGQHALEASVRFPNAKILAIDLSAASLAYARRRTRELGVTNIEYGQADILKLGNLGRTFDRIEAVGVLHHLADPEKGWQTLLPLLRAGGLMYLGLYSEIARRPIVEARALIAQKNYPPTAEGIRECRAAIYRDRSSVAGQSLPLLQDFYSTSSCRDLLFHVMEHRFTLPGIKSFLARNALTFVGFLNHPRVFELFDRRFPDPRARGDLDRWDEFERENPASFASMYQFLVRKDV